MPLFFRKRKPSEDSQKRLEYQLCRVTVPLKALLLSGRPASVLAVATLTWYLYVVLLPVGSFTTGTGVREVLWSRSVTLLCSSAV